MRRWFRLRPCKGHGSIKSCCSFTNSGVVSTTMPDKPKPGSDGEVR